MTRDMRNPRTGQATGAHEGVRPDGLNTPNSTGTAPASHAAPPREMHPEAAEDVAVRLLLERDPVALACHRLGLESRSLPKPSRLHPDDVALIACQVAVEIQLGEQAAQVARAVQNSPQRYTGTALDDRAAAGRENDPFPTYTHDELTEIERNREAAA